MSGCSRLDLIKDETQRIKLTMSRDTEVKSDEENHTKTNFIGMIDMRNSSECGKEYVMKGILEEYGMVLGGSCTFALLLGMILSANMLRHLLKVIS